jgi:hypothetical protein
MSEGRFHWAEFDRDFDIGTEGVAQLTDRRERLLEILGCDELIPVAGCGGVEGPDLDGLNAARVDELTHDLFRFAVEVVLVGEAGVVQADAGVGFASDQAVDGRIEVFPEQVPEGEVDGAQGPDLRRLSLGRTVTPPGDVI